jgi:hypothetical protein
MAALAAGAARADGPDPGGETLHRLGPDPLQLRFEGETSARTWPIYVTEAEARTRARVHIGFANAISVMPEASSIAVSVNDVAVAQTPIAAATDPGALDVELPRGLLIPGYNSVRISVSQRHRVDCSMEATYELWTQVDPATSGLSFPGVADPQVERLDDLAALSPDASGAFPIRVAIPEGADAEAVDAAMRAVEAVAIRAGAQRPKIEIVGEIGERAGLYVLAGQRDYLAGRGFARFLPSGSGRALAVEGQDAPGRVVVAAVGDSYAETAEAIDGLLPMRRAEERAENPAVARALANRFGYPVTGPLRAPLKELGVRTEEFSGRLYRAAFDITLPGDFYPADYDKLTLSLTAGYAEGLLPTSQILVRVNDREAGSAPLKNPRGALFRDRPVSVSLSALRPGVNHVVVEAQTPDAADGSCEVKHLMDARKRFVLFDTSELVMPAFARIGRMPDLAATLSSGFPYMDGGLIYAPNRDRRTLAALAAYLARSAVTAGRILGARVSFDAEAAQRGPALFVGALDEFPARLIEKFGVDYQQLKASWSGPNADALIVAPGGAPSAQLKGSAEVYDQWAEGGHVTPADFSPRRSLRALYDRYVNVHLDDFALLRDAERPIEAPQRATILLAQTRDPSGAGAWTLVVAPNAATLARDMPNLVAPSNWNEVEGRASAFAPRSGVTSLGAAIHSYFLPTETLTPGNLRLIAAGFMSANLDDYLIAFLVAAAALGVATFAAVRAHGNRS